LKNPVFKDPTIEKLFQKNGFVVLPLLSKLEVEELLAFYEANPNDVTAGFHATHFSKNRPYKKRVHQQIIATFESGLSKLLSEYNLIFANFMVKETGDNSLMPLHADWTYVDEKQFQSLGIWCPLIDTNEYNGRLGVVPFSHHLKANNRGPKIPSPFVDHNDYIIEQHGTLLNVDAGSVVIYDHRLLHFSPANFSNTKRVSVNITATPTHAEVAHYAYFENTNTINKYNVSGSDFFLEYDHFEEPDFGKAIATFEVHIEPFDLNYIEGVLRPKRFFTTLKSFFKK
jgi:hypothetical protein